MEGPGPDGAGRGQRRRRVQRRLMCLARRRRRCLLRRLERAHLDDTAQGAWLATEAPAEPPHGHSFCNWPISADCRVGEVVKIVLATGYSIKLKVRAGWPGAEVRVAVPSNLLP